MAEEQIDSLVIRIETQTGNTGNIDKLKKKIDDVTAAAKRSQAEIAKMANDRSDRAAYVKWWSSQPQTKAEIAAIVDEAMSGNETKKAKLSSTGSLLEPHPVYSRKNWGYNKDLMEEIELLEKFGTKEAEKAHIKWKKNLDKDIAKMRKELEKTDKAATKAAKSTSKLLSTFARIIRFRIASLILQKVINAIKEGTTSLAEYDKQFKDTLNSYQASFKQIGGGSALVLSPILGGLEGMVGLLSDGVGALTNTISALMAGFTNEGKYTAVKTVKEIKEELAAADKKAKDLRHTISGFDELNIFSNKNQSETIDIFTTKEIGSMDHAMDIAGMTALAATAAIVGRAIVDLTAKFGKKNKTLKEQTADTKVDAQETSKLGDVIKSLVPKAGAAITALGGLGALVLTPLLKKEGVTVPAAEAEAALDALGESNPAPVIETSALDASMETVKSTISDGMSSVVTTIDTKFSEINEKFSTLLSDLTTKWEAFVSGFSGGGIKLPMGDLTGGRLRGVIPNLGFDLSGSTSGATTSTTAQTTKTEDKILKFVESEESKKKTQLYGGGAALAAALLFGAIGSKALGGIGGGLGGKKFAGAHANGGLVDSGEFFLARENGMPEFVGSFGAKAGVANNEQIVSGIAGGVESALSAYVPQIIRAIENNAAVVNIGDDQIARSAQRGAARYQRITGQPMFS